MKKWLLTSFKINTLPETHIVDRYLEPLKQNNLSISKVPLDFFLSPDEEQSAKEMLKDLTTPYAAIAIGAAHFTKSPPLELWSKILSQLKIKAVLLGGPKEMENAKILSSKHEILNLVGVCSIGESAAIIKSSAFVIAPDTGLMHIAAAFQKPIASIWGNTVPAFGMYPYYGLEEVPQYNAEVDLTCRPCSKIGHSKCPKGHFNCMNLQNVEEIVKWTEALTSD